MRKSLCRRQKAVGEPQSRDWRGCSYRKRGRNGIGVRKKSREMRNEKSIRENLIANGILLLVSASKQNDNPSHQKRTFLDPIHERSAIIFHCIHRLGYSYKFGKGRSQVVQIIARVYPPRYA